MSTTFESFRDQVCNRIWIFNEEEPVWEYNNTVFLNEEDLKQYWEEVFHDEPDEDSVGDER